MFFCGWLYRRRPNGIRGGTKCGIAVAERSNNFLGFEAKRTRIFGLDPKQVFEQALNFLYVLACIFHRCGQRYREIVQFLNSVLNWEIFIFAMTKFNMAAKRRKRHKN